MNKRKTKSEKASEKSSQKVPKIVDLDEYRRNKHEQKRREYERILFNRVLGIYSFIERGKLKHVEVVDISHSGSKLREAKPEAPLKLGVHVAVRFYFTPESYLRIVAMVKRVTPFTENGRAGLEYGCEFDTTTKSYAVIHQLVDFMRRYTETACHDPNPPILFF